MQTDSDNLQPILQGAFVAIFIVLSILLLLIGLLGIHFSDLGQGEHSGYITAIDQRGYIFKNYDVYFKTDNSSSQEDTYCIDRYDTNLVEIAQQVNKSRQQITINYKGVRGWGYSLCGYAQITNIIIK